MTESDTFEAARKAWKYLPADGIGNIAGEEVLRLNDNALRQFVAIMESNRFGPGQNFHGLLRSMMTDHIVGKTVLDYGCGLGIEALQLARQGNSVYLADINTESAKAACRIMELSGFLPLACIVIDGADTWPDEQFVDMFYCSGVLHHIRNPRPVMEDAHRMLTTGGEARLLLYSDKAWTAVTSQPADINADPQSYPEFMTYVRSMDVIGDYSDWYNREKLEARFGDLFTVEEFAYLRPDQRYCAARLRKIS